MLPVEEQLSILVHLSMADKFLAEEESKLIHKIGERNGLSVADVELIMDNPKPIPNLKDLPPDEKFDYLFSKFTANKHPMLVGFRWHHYRRIKVEAIPHRKV